MSMTWKEAVMKVIEEAKGPLHYHDVTRIILDNEMVLTRGATPHGTVNVVLNDLYRNGEEVGGRRIVKPNPGEFELVPWDGSLLDVDDPDDPIGDGSGNAEDGIGIAAYGLFWKRDQVQWSARPRRLLGREDILSQPVNFADQRGVYLLYQMNKVVYVGLTAKQKDGLFIRLEAHTKDKLQHRWDRFSWFGTREVREDGSLTDEDVSATGEWSERGLVRSLEAVLIEVLLPPLNDKRELGLTPFGQAPSG